jgi:hypothetical protein
MVKLDNFPVFSTKTQKNQLLQKKCQNSPWTNFHHFGQKINFCSLKSHQIVSNEHGRRKKRKKIFFDVKARTTVPTPFHAQWARPVNCQNREIRIE